MASRQYLLLPRFHRTPEIASFHLPTTWLMASRVDLPFLKPYWLSARWCPIAASIRLKMPASSAPRSKALVFDSQSYGTMVTLCVDFRHLTAVISFGQATADKHEIDHLAVFSPDERWVLSVVQQREVQQGEGFQDCKPPLLCLLTAPVHKDICVALLLCRLDEKSTWKLVKFCSFWKNHRPNSIIWPKWRPFKKMRIFIFKIMLL